MTTLVRTVPDTYEKLQHLGTMATDDVLGPTGETNERLAQRQVPRRGGAREHIAGVYPAKMPNGRTISLLRVMFTDFCMFDCHYCPNSHWVPRRRYAFKVEELAGLFMELQRRLTVDGLFLSSGIAGSPDKTMDKLVRVVELLRTGYGYKGYIHLKVMPGSSYQYVEAASRLGTRLSVNMETPSAEMLRRISPMKDFQRGILEPMAWVRRLAQERDGTAVGQATQLVVGAADESDLDIFRRVRQLYHELDLKRVYYAAFRPVRHTPLEEHPATPMAREHRLYQLDWLTRVYGFSDEELARAFDRRGFLDLDVDPKTVLALERLGEAPVDVNHASYDELLRVPGIGPTAAARIVRQRRLHSIQRWQELQAMGVVTRRAKAFLVLPGYRPERGQQARMELFQEPRGPAPDRRPSAASTPTEGAPCGLRSSCAGCPVSHGAAA